MSRKPRNKAPLCVHHLISKSIRELLLFKDNQDKNKYLQLVKKYKLKFNFKIYSYCLMNNHVHLHVDPQGSDISRFMKGINLSYVIYYNQKYNREGSVFKGRFKNKVVLNDEYNLILSSYIHNNPKDIPCYSSKTHLYPYSSFGIYTGHIKDTLNLVDTDFILQYFSNKKSIAKKLYFNFVNKKQVKCKNHYKHIQNISNNEYSSERFTLIRDFSPKEVLSIVAKAMNISNINIINLKYNHQSSIFRAFCALILHSFCDFSYKDICKVIGNISLGGVCRLCNEAIDLILHCKKHSEIYNTIIHELYNS